MLFTCWFDLSVQSRAFNTSVLCQFLALLCSEGRHSVAMEMTYNLLSFPYAIILIIGGGASGMRSPWRQADRQTACNITKLKFVFCNSHAFQNYKNYSIQKSIPRVTFC